jgi:hypothetical protein
MKQTLEHTRSPQGGDGTKRRVAAKRESRSKCPYGQISFHSFPNPISRHASGEVYNVYIMKITCFPT